MSNTEIILKPSDWKVNNQGFIVYKDIQLPITLTNLQDYTAQTEQHYSQLILHHWNNSLQKKRNDKLNQIIND